MNNVILKGEDPKLQKSATQYQKMVQISMNCQLQQNQYIKSQYARMIQGHGNTIYKF